ncbi:MAG: thiamine phosphate synthase [Pirellulaceae bacterium]
MSFSDGQSEPHRVWRTIDANLNRAGEALRVIEDGLRFVIEDAHLARVCKGLRHELKLVADQWPRESLLAMRNASGDVGRHTDVAEEYQRSGMADVLSANFARASQSLRVMEEFAKMEEFSRLAGSAAAQGIEQLRYALYDLEKAAMVTLNSQSRLAEVQLYVLVDGCSSTTAFEEQINQLIYGGVDAIQLRDKTLSDRDLVARARQLVALARPHGVLSIINDRADVAVTARADGLHLGQDDMDLSSARQIVGSQILVGISTHSLEQARRAQRSGADYIGVGPVFESSTKTFAAHVGPQLLHEVGADISLPSFAIGGITLDNLDLVIAAGFSRVAVSGGVISDRELMQEMARSFKMRLSSNRSRVDSC